MPIKPKKQQLSATSADILNAIRNSSSANYQNAIPLIEGDLDEFRLRSIGSTLMDYKYLQNEFVSTLFNKIGLTIVRSAEFSNPWSFLKRGMLSDGETVEEIFVDIAKPHMYSQERAESQVFKREIPDVRVAYHPMNYATFYKRTLSDAQLKKAFNNPQAFMDMVNRVTESMYKSADFDEFLMMKYLIALSILKGELVPSAVPAVIGSNMANIAKAIQTKSNELVFPSSKHTRAGNINTTEKNKQYLIVTSKFQAELDIDVLANAFNMDKAEFRGHVVIVDGFGEIDMGRIRELFNETSLDANASSASASNEAIYRDITAEELDALNEIPAILVDESWFQIYDVLNEVTSIFNPEGLYTNYWHHVWKTFATSPFFNAVVFVGGTPSVTSVAISPSAVTLPAGGETLLTATVVVENYASRAVDWTVSSADEDKIYISPLGQVKLLAGAESGDSITVTATSAVDPDKSATCTITVQ